WEEGVTKNPEVVIPHQTNAEFIIESYDSSCYLYDTMPLFAFFSCRRQRPSATPRSFHGHPLSLGVMKKTLGLMVFEALYRQFDFSDETIQ
ncbi:Protein msta_ isoform Alike, partial [Caligus rogercresseyi]